MLKFKILVCCLFGILFAATSVLSLPTVFALLLVKLLWVADLEILWCVGLICLFIISVPLWWYFKMKVSELILEKEKNENEK